MLRKVASTSDKFFIINLFIAAMGALMIVSGCSSFMGKAPPIQPHVSTGQYKICKDCHEKGQNGAKITNHPNKPDCGKCHVVKVK